MMQSIGQSNAMIHVRFAGQSHRIEASALDVGIFSSDGDIRQALAGYFRVSNSKFAGYVIERHDNGNVTIRPEAVFG
jgi:hypothetical protein